MLFLLGCCCALFSESVSHFPAIVERICTPWCESVGVVAGKRASFPRGFGARRAPPCEAAKPKLG